MNFSTTIAIIIAKVHAAIFNLSLARDVSHEGHHNVARDQGRSELSFGI